MGPTTYVRFGNDTAVEAYRDPSSDDPDKVRYRAVGGQRVTTLTFLEDVPLAEAFTTAVTTVNHHFDGAQIEGTPSQDRPRPAWVESDSPGLQALLTEHYGVKASRPRSWKGQ